MATSTATPTSFSAGGTLTAAQMNQNVRDHQLAFGAWGSFASAWTSSGTAPALGNGTLVCNYMQVQKLVNFRIALTLGTTSTIGTGAYSLSLPVAAVAAGYEQLVTGMYLDSSTGFYYRGEGRIGSAASSIGRGLFVDGAATTLGWSATAPVVPATGDQIIFCGSYEAA